MSSDDETQSSAASGINGNAGSADVDNLVCQLFDQGLITDGGVTLRNGLQAPMQMDLRGLVSLPQLMQQVAGVMVKASKTLLSDNDLICGIPYTATPLTTIISVQLEKPMVVVRLAARRDYGVGQQIQGRWRGGQKCMLINDVCSSAYSVLNVATTLRISKARGSGEERVGGPLIVNDILVLVDRETGDRELLEAGGIQLHSVVTMTQVCEILNKSNRISVDVVDKVGVFTREMHATTMERTKSRVVDSKGGCDEQSPATERVQKSLKSRKAPYLPAAVLVEASVSVGADGEQPDGPVPGGKRNWRRRQKEKKLQMLAPYLW